MILPWPPDYIKEAERRLFNLEKIMGNPDLEAMSFAIYAGKNAYDWEACVAWINDFCVTFDPRNVDPDPKLMPFKLFPRQEEFVRFILECLRDKQDGLVEKSRDMGATWLCCCISVWLWIFHPGSTVGWGSLLERNIDDRGNPKAIFLKIRQIIANLPPFMRPEGYDERMHAPSMKILHPHDTATIIGEGGKNVGRGGRTTIYFKDESAHYEHPEEIEASLGDNTDVQIDISSVNGSANVFYRKRMAGEVWEPDKKMTPGKVRVFIFDWRDHPGKSKEWYDMRYKKAEEQGLLHILAQEVDRNYAASLDRIIIRPEWVEAAVDAHLVLGIKDDGERGAGQDVADGGKDKNALIIRYGVVARFGADWAGEADDAFKTALPYLIEHSVKKLDYDSVGVGAGYKTAVKSLRDGGQIPKHLKISPWNGGGEVQDPDKHIIPDDKESPTNKDQYLNLKAQSWFRLRTRFYKTFMAVRHGKVYPHEELISLDSKMPCLHQLKMELSQAQHNSNMKGKTIVDKQPDGADSPHLADACVTCYNPIRKPLGFFSNEWEL